MFSFKRFFLELRLSKSNFLAPLVFAGVGLLVFAPGDLSAAPAQAGAKISGKVFLSAELAQELKSTAALYIMARSTDPAARMPLAVLRIPQPLKFPLDFTLTDQHAMIPGNRLQGKVLLSARINQTGAAGPAQPGDIESRSGPLTYEVSGARASRSASLTLDLKK
jgi:hypothetical protein